MSMVLNAIQPVYLALLRLLALAAALSIIGFVTLIALDFALRLFAQVSLPWLNEVLEYALYLSVILSAPWLLHLNGHVRLDVADQVLSRSASRKLSVLAETTGGVVSFVMAWFGSQAAIDAFSAGTRQYKVLTIDIWWLLGAFALSMALLSIEFAFRFSRALHDLLVKGEPR